MTGQPLRLDELGADPASVLKVVAYFDDLDDRRCGAADLVRAAARLAGCPVAARADDPLCFDAAGAALNPGVDLDEGDVRVLRDGPAAPLDAVVRDRLRRSLRLCRARRFPAPALGDPALVEVVISSRQDPAARARAARLLGFDESLPVRVLAVSTDAPATLSVVLDVLGGDRVRTTTIGTTIAVAYQGSRDARTLSDALEDAISAAFPTPLPAGAGRGPWIGIGSPTDIFSTPTSWHQARRALRFASSTGYGRRAIAFERLSVLELLADLPVDAVLSNPDVARIDELAATPAGAVEVATAEAFCKYGSLRRTAEELYVHHSTVASRLAHVAERMGWDFDDPMDRFIATLVFLVRRIALSSAELGDTG
ncbi:pucR C-terminal helix-turn-helix domain protein [Mycolicibacterium hassiacum DSM 44199]|uniref:PucR C-terminal helix-turn-helix domain protein n=1 Tax=Mycolicibacterium hassiacum (strain DSM 44199 / CIP 105218 / JCM 12690 / 3849) TaxID=1122247 RepID=K5B7P8_MYCHD|nr:helix-turn-helix domain-containing protein [Mycolicibacterium hassiacum]EKF22323.1 pucR C-terminal helix-turn-helix domain protein [Mycolicibacterium hassiacum DSM 44199]MDA4087405.1 hypothetical protein [Mycolicibacterium hassiacum DSM 44199]VCT91970.1 hypothetical protein MHAS_03694 [Mycolicibacterium hassiacum DSM 44199]